MSDSESDSEWIARICKRNGTTLAPELTPELRTLMKLQSDNHIASREYYNQNKETIRCKYQGQWIGICVDRIVCSGNSHKDLHVPKNIDSRGCFAVFVE